MTVLANFVELKLNIGPVLLPMLQCGRWTMLESDQFSGLTVVPTSTISWVKGKDGFVPNGAVIGGKTFAQEITYIGRTRLLENRNELTPGVIIPSKK